MGITNLEDLYPLSPLQQGILFHALYAPNSRVYSWQLSCTLKNLNVPAFKRTWEMLLTRHPTLRTSFVWEDLPEPVQMVHKSVDLPLEQLDKRGMSRSQQQEHLEAFLEEDRARGFDLSAAPLMRLTLIQIDDDSYYFVWSHHHLLLDGWSGAQVNKEFFIFYKSFSRGESLNIEPPPPYRNYIAWLQQQDLEKAEVFWRRTLEGFTAPTPLVFDREVVASKVEDADYEEQWIRLSEDTTASLRLMARSRGITLNTIAQGIWALLLSRYSGEEDVVFGAVVSGRSAALPGIESMTGLFINTLPVRVRVSPDARLLDWLEQLQSQQAEMRQYEYSPLVEIQGWSDMPRTVPLFDSALVFENYPMDEFLKEWDSNLEISNYRVVERNHYPITLVIGPSRQLKLRLVYDRDRFKADTVARMLGNLRTLLEAIIDNPDCRLAHLPLLTEEDRDQLLTWSRSTAERLEPDTIGRCFEMQVDLQPDAVAVTLDEKQLTCEELNARANRLAHYLRGIGVGPESRVGVYMEPSIEWVVGMLAIFKAGGVYVPLDVELPEDRVAFMLEDAQVSVLLSEEQSLSGLPACASSVEILCLDLECEAIAQQSDSNPANQAAVDNLAYIIYTSGSTGRPKGVAVSHGSAIKHMRSIQAAFRLERSDRFLQFASFAFDVSIEQTLAPLLCGASLVVRGGAPWHPSELTKRLDEMELTVINLPPAYWNQWVQELTGDADRPRGRSLRQVIIGGDIILPESIRQWQRYWPIPVRLLNAYGPTEATITSTVFEIPHGLFEEASSLPVPVGRPIGDRACYIISKWGDASPVGVIGELQIGGGLLARCYLGRPDLTSEKFRPDPYADTPGARLYKTGDLARFMRDGNIEFRGRLDHQVKIRGFRIEPGEIESVLKQCAGVKESIVVARASESGDKRLVAYLVACSDPAPSVGELREFLQSRLPEYMVPSLFITLESLPLTASGKVDRAALPEPDQTGIEEEGGAAARTPVEERLAELWREILGVEIVGVQNNFFDLGGHSLLLTQLASRIKKTFDVELPLPVLFDNPTLEMMGAAIIAGQVEQGGQEEFIEILEELKYLSPTEVETLLNEERVRLSEK